MALNNVSYHYNEEKDHKEYTYTFACYDVTIKQLEGNSSLEYQVSYDEITMRELTNFISYETSLKIALRK